MSSYLYFIVDAAEKDLITFCLSYSSLKIDLKPRKNLLLALIALFAVFSLVAAAAGLYYFSVPTEVETTVTLWAFKHTGRYDCVAELKPNSLYNRTSLRPEEGTFYSRIIDRMNVVFTYVFDSSLPATGTVDYNVSVVVSTKSWKKVLNTTSATFNLKDAKSFSTTHSFNISKFGDLVYSIDKETGIFSYEYNVTISHAINVKAASDAGSVNEVFTPSLDFIVKSRSESGDVIVPEGVNHARSGGVTRQQKIVLGSLFGIYRWQYRYLSILGFAVAFSIFVYLVRWYRKTYPKAREKPIKDLVKPYRGIISDSLGSMRVKGEIVITMSSLEDLVKVSDNLGKPIVHTRRDKTHTYYLYDGTVKYEFNKDEALKP